MITIRTMLLSDVAKIDEELGFNWRRGELPEADAEGCVNVTLGYYVIMKASGDSDIRLDLGGKKYTLERFKFEEICII